ncbi:MAG: aldehyde dehydrogenase family protein [Nitrospirae bacterium]|nr:aldehyde dehydrogenase family protein [Nitrospirota bacterium]
MAENHGMLIGGKWREDSRGGRRIQVRNPFDGSVVGSVPEAGQDEVEEAVRAAEAGFRILSRMPAHRRSEILEKASGLIEERADDLARTITLESGKPVKDARGEVGRAVQTFRFSAQEALRIHGETLPMDAHKAGEGRFGFWLRVPVGIVGAITPFNFPLNLVAHKIAPAIAAGCSVVLKPASQTPITSVKLGEIFLEAGLPPGALNIVFGGGATVGDWIVSHPKIAKISFTGSPAVGRHIVARAGLKKVTMELGSNSAVVIDEDADVEKALPRCVLGGFAQAGQSCISVQRIFVHRKLYQGVQDVMTRSVETLRMGNPLDANTDVGPMISESEAKRAHGWIEEAVAKGARVLTGGRCEGAMLTPTVLADARNEMKVMASEIFAPVVAMAPFDTFDEALRMVNDSIYGLQAGVFTRDLGKAMRAVQELDVGGVIINDIPTVRVDHQPYGGVKESGLGREGPRFAVEEMTTLKMVVFNL